MSKAAQPSGQPALANAGLPSAPDSFEQYQSLKSAAVPGAPPATEELVPASEPEEPPDGEHSARGPQEQKPATDEEKADRKQRNDQRRERRWFEERGAIRAEN